VFLTAAHCDEGTLRVTVTFDTAYQDGDKTYSGTWYADPLYGHDQSDPHDIAVVVFDKPIKDITPAQLPSADSLSNLSTSQQFRSVDYGAYEVTNGPGGHQYLYNDVRMVATGTLAPATQQAYLRYVEQLALFTGTSPDLATDEGFRQFFLALHKRSGLSRSSVTVAIAAFKFLFEVTLRRPWPRLDLFRPRPTQTLPLILSVNEVWHILDHVDHPTYYTCLANIRKLADLMPRLAFQPR
jgi:hypothetical protein